MGGYPEMEDRWTILRVIQWTTDYFRQKGLDQPRSDAEVLLAHVLGIDRLELYLNYDQPLTTDERARYRAVVRRRANREPVQYITGRQEFWSLELEVSPAVLIPRPETEVLVEKALDVLKGSGNYVLDLGTGSGAIAIALAYECSALKVVAVDKSYEAIKIAAKNAIRHRVEKRVHFIAADLCSCISPERGLFDVIVSNPPYISENEYLQLAPEIRFYEPSTALLGGRDGLRIIERIVQDALAHLKDNGSLLIEIGAGQAALLAEILTQNPMIGDFEFIRDYSGIRRVLHIRRSNR